MRTEPFFALLGFLLFAGVTPAGSAEVELSKSDLVGHSMGGREASWHFRSADQIKSMIVQSKTDEGSKRIYRVTLELQDAASPGKYKADALVRCDKTGAGLKVESVGLVSIAKVE